MQFNRNPLRGFRDETRVLIDRHDFPTVHFIYAHGAKSQSSHLESTFNLMEHISFSMKRINKHCYYSM
jgi:hypothetical protein